MSTGDIFPNWRGDEPWEPRAAALAGACPVQPSYAALEDRMTAEPGRSYHLDPAVAACLDDQDEADRRRYIHGFLLWQMRRFPDRFAQSGLDAEFAAQFADSFHRIMDSIEANSLPADLRSDLLVKDLAITRLVLIPAVAQLIHPHSLVQRRPLLRWGPKGWAYVFGRCGGYRPFAEIHTHDPMAGAYFNPQGWEESYRLTALLLRSQPHCRGLVGYSWFYDPALDRWSPRLGYLRASPLSQGARLMPMEEDEDSARLATATSPTRREAYHAGQYHPRRYGLIWSRGDILRHYLPG